MIWNKKAETMERSELIGIQTARLRSTVKHAYDNVPFYKKQFDSAGISPQEINTLADIEKIPFTTKSDMRDNYPYGLLAVPMREIVRIHASSGTTGKPTVVAYTKGDIEVWAEVLGRTLVAGGLNENSIFQVAVNYGLFTGGLGMHYAAEFVGATVVPASTGHTSRQAMLMMDFGTTAMIATPSYALHLAEAMKQFGIDPRSTKLEAMFCGAEAWSDEMHKEIEDQFGVEAFDVYGLSEIIGPGVGAECECHNGLHIHEDHFFPEVIDPETGKTLPEGTVGELVLTTLTRRGTPMLRYRTRDLTAIEHVPCDCGRTLIKMRRVIGRNDDMLIIRGVNIFPSQVEAVLLAMGDTAPHYQLIIDRENNLDVLTVEVERIDDSASKTGAAVTESQIRERLKASLGIQAGVNLLDPHTIKRSEGKAQRVIDRRKI